MQCSRAAWFLVQEGSPRVRANTGSSMIEVVSEMRLDGRQRGGGLGKPAESVRVSHVQDRHGGAARMERTCFLRPRQGGLGRGRGAAGWRYGFSPEAKEQVGQRGSPAQAGDSGSLRIGSRGSHSQHREPFGGPVVPPARRGRHSPCGTQCAQQPSSSISQRGSPRPVILQLF